MPWYNRNGQIVPEDELGDGERFLIRMMNEIYGPHHDEIVIRQLAEEEFARGGTNVALLVRKIMAESSNKPF